MEQPDLMTWLDTETLDQGTSYIGHSYYLIRNNITNSAFAGAFILDEQILDFTPMRDYILILVDKPI